MEVTIVHHLGLGDHIMLNGMARYLSSKGYKVHVIVKKNQYESIQYMYRDSDISVLTTESDDVNDVRRIIKGISLNLATYGLDEHNWKQITENFGTWSSVPYYQAGINPIYMRSRFKLVRDKKREDDFLKTFGDDDFIFLHDASPIHRCPKIDTNYKIVKPDVSSPQFNIFDWLGVLEKAKEIHCVNSAFTWLVDLCKVGTKETNFFHLNCSHSHISTKEVMCVFSEDQWTFKNE